MPDTFTPEQISQILEEFFKVVGTRQYIGPRWIPLFGRKGEDSIEWDNSAPYEPLTIVLYQGNSYTSRQYVPVGVEITNQQFWAITGNYNAQVEQYRRDTAAAREVADNALSAANDAQTDIDTLLPKADFSAENTVKDYIDTSVAAVQTDIDTLLPKADFSADNTIKDYIDSNTDAFNQTIDDIELQIDYIEKFYGSCNLGYVTNFAKTSSGDADSGLQGGVYIGNNTLCMATVGYIATYDLTSGNKINELSYPQLYHANTLSFDGTYIYVLSQNNATNQFVRLTTDLAVVDTIDLTQFMFYSHLYFAAVNSDNKLIIVDTNLNTPLYASSMSVWDFNERSLIARKLFDFNDSQGFFYNIAVDDKYVYLGYNNNSIVTYYIETLEPKATIEYTTTINGCEIYEAEFITKYDDKMLIGGIDRTGGIRLVGSLSFNNLGRTIPYGANVSTVHTPGTIAVYLDTSNSEAYIDQRGTYGHPYASLSQAMTAVNAMETPNVVELQAKGACTSNDGIYVYKDNAILTAESYLYTRLNRVVDAAGVKLVRNAYETLVLKRSKAKLVQNADIQTAYGSQQMHVSIDNTSELDVVSLRQVLEGYNGGMLNFIDTSIRNNGEFVNTADNSPLVVGDAPKNVVSKIPNFSQAATQSFSIMNTTGFILIELVSGYHRVPFFIPAYGNSAITMPDGTVINFTRTVGNKTVTVDNGLGTESTISVPYSIFTMSNTASIQDIIIHFM